MGNNSKEKYFSLSGHEEYCYNDMKEGILSFLIKEMTSHYKEVISNNDFYIVFIKYRG